jgi:hypothetical protein
VYHSFDAGHLRSFKEGLAVGNRVGVVEKAMIESHPVGVVKRRYPFEGLGKVSWSSEIEREGIHSVG